LGSAIKSTTRWLAERVVILCRRATTALRYGGNVTLKQRLQAHADALRRCIHEINKIYGEAESVKEKQVYINTTHYLAALMRWNDPKDVPDDVDPEKWPLKPCITREELRREYFQIVMADAGLSEPQLLKLASQKRSADQITTKQKIDPRVLKHLFDPKVGAGHVREVAWRKACRDVLVDMLGEASLPVLNSIFLPEESDP
jgi:hypothetical protein